MYSCTPTTYEQMPTWQTAACSMASSPPSGVSMLPEMRWRLITRVNSLILLVMLRTWWKPWAGRQRISKSLVRDKKNNTLKTRSCLQDLELQSYLLYAQLILMTMLPQATKKLNIFVYIFTWSLKWWHHSSSVSFYLQTLANEWSYLQGLLIFEGWTLM